jgi:hypothetical protein
MKSKPSIDKINVGNNILELYISIDFLRFVSVEKTSHRGRRLYSYATNDVRLCQHNNLYSNQETTYMKTKDDHITGPTLVAASEINTRLLCKPVTAPQVNCNPRSNLLQIYVKENTSIRINNIEKSISGFIEINNNRKKTNITITVPYNQSCILGPRDYHKINLSNLVIGDLTIHRLEEKKSALDRFDQAILKTMKHYESVGASVILSSEKYIKDKWQYFIHMVVHYVVFGLVIVTIILVLYFKKDGNESKTDSIELMDMSNRIHRLEIR